MDPQDIPLLIEFLSLVGGVYLISAIFLLDALVRRLNGKGLFGSIGSARAFVVLRGLVLSVALVGILCTLYAHFIEPYWPFVSHITVSTKKLKAANGPVRVVQISDLHCDSAPRLEKVLPGLIAKEHPDIIVFTGDTVNSPENLPLFKSTMKQISAIAPTFSCDGDWEIGDFDYWGETGVTDLKKAAKKITCHGQELCLAGLPPYLGKSLPEALHDIPAGLFTMLLFHYPYPDVLDNCPAGTVDLMLSGHTHGGQVCMPFYGAIITHSKYGHFYESGSYEVGPNTLMYVNQGIGMDGHYPRIRFLSRPEITAIDIVPFK